jgi:hypothetical protein
MATIYVVKDGAVRAFRAEGDGAQVARLRGWFGAWFGSKAAAESARKHLDALTASASVKATDEPQAHAQATDEPQAHAQATDEPQAHAQATDEPQAHAQATDESQAHAQATDEPQAHAQATDEPQAHATTRRDLLALRARALLYNGAEWRPLSTLPQGMRVKLTRIPESTAALCAAAEKLWRYLDTRGLHACVVVSGEGLAVVGAKVKHLRKVGVECL